MKPACPKVNRLVLWLSSVWSKCQSLGDTPSWRQSWAGPLGNKEFTSSQHYFKLRELKSQLPDCAKMDHWKERSPLSINGCSGSQKKGIKGPYLPSLSGWISSTAPTAPSCPQSSASRAGGTLASRFWWWCQPWDQRQTSSPWEEVSPRSPWGSNWSRLGQSAGSGPEYHCLLSHTGTGP